jgi:hypothetical protein
MALKDFDHRKWFHELPKEEHFGPLFVQQVAPQYCLNGILENVRKFKYRTTEEAFEECEYMFHIVKTRLNQKNEIVFYTNYMMDNFLKLLPKDAVRGGDSAEPSYHFKILPRPDYVRLEHLEATASYLTEQINTLRKLPTAVLTAPTSSVVSDAPKKKVTIDLPDPEAKTTKTPAAAAAAAAVKRKSTETELPKKPALKRSKSAPIEPTRYSEAVDVIHSMPSPPQKKVSYLQRKILQRQVSELPTAQINVLIAMLERANSKGLVESPDGSIEIDFEAMEIPVVRQIKAYVRKETRALVKKHHL